MYKGSMVVIVNGVQLELYTIGTLAKMLKKSVETIRAWERQRIIPGPMYKNKKVRLYHPKEVEAMKRALKKAGKSPKKEEIQKHMWACLKEARLEIRNGSS